MKCDLKVFFLLLQWIPFYEKQKQIKLQRKKLEQEAINKAAVKF